MKKILFYLLILLSFQGFSQKLSVETISKFDDNGKKINYVYCILKKDTIALDSLFIYIYYNTKENIYYLKDDSTFYETHTEYDVITSGLFYAKETKTAQLKKYKIKDNKIVLDTILKLSITTKNIISIFHNKNNKCKGAYSCTPPKFYFKDNNFILTIGKKPQAKKFIINKSEIKSLKQLKKQLKKFFREFNKEYGIKTFYKIGFKVEVYNIS